jgi:hypothetical protein
MSNLQPAPRHVLRSRIWFQIRHHQDNLSTNGRHWFVFDLAASLAIGHWVVIRELQATIEQEAAFPMNTSTV